MTMPAAQASHGPELYEPSRSCTSPSPLCGPRRKCGGRVLLTPLFLSEKSTPTIQHLSRFSNLQWSCIAANFHTAVQILPRSRAGRETCLRGETMTAAVWEGKASSGVSLCVVDWAAANWVMQALEWGRPGHAIKTKRRRIMASLQGGGGPVR